MVRPLQGAVFGRRIGVNIQWEGHDADGDEVVYLASLGTPSGDWVPLTAFGSETYVALDVSGLDPGDYVVRVLGTDGLNTTEATATFVVSPGAPTDSDGDGTPDTHDPCPELPGGGGGDADGDGVGDACDLCPADPKNDSDHDGVCDDLDLCPHTRADPASGVPSTGVLGRGRWADLDGDGVLELGGGGTKGAPFTVVDMGGCGCAQVLAAMSSTKLYGSLGCPTSVIEAWMEATD
jgi:hypothetical protein